MASRQIDPDERRARRQRVDRLISTLEAGVAQRALYDEGSLWGFDIDSLEWELEGMRKHLHRTLSAPKPNGLGSVEAAEALEASLFSADRDAARNVLKARMKELQQLRVDRTAKNAVRIHFLIQKAREVLPDIEAAREEQAAREAAERETAFQARVAEAKAAGKLRELTWNGVCRLITDAGHSPDTWGSPSSLYGQALRLGVISDVEYDVAQRGHGRGWNYAGD